jgi:phosphoribosylpyrophosphate synthetase
MKVHFISGYYSDLAHKNKKKRPEEYWQAYFFCWAVKTGLFKRPFNIIKAKSTIRVANQNDAKVPREVFGKWAEKRVADMTSDDVLLVPIPSKDGISAATNYRTLTMAKESFSDTRYKSATSDGLRWSERLSPAHEGGPRGKDQLAPYLTVDEKLRGKDVILVDDLFSTGGTLLAAEEVLKAKGASVVGAITCGRTIYDLNNTKAFGSQTFELTEELADWDG